MATSTHTTSSPVCDNSAFAAEDERDRLMSLAFDQSLHDHPYKNKSWAEAAKCWLKDNGAVYPVERKMTRIVDYALTPPLIKQEETVLDGLGWRDQFVAYRDNPLLGKDIREAFFRGWIARAALSSPAQEGEAAPVRTDADGELRNDYITDAQARELFGEDDDEPMPEGRVRVCDGEWVRIPGGYYFDKSAGPLHPETASKACDQCAVTMSMPDGETSAAVADDVRKAALLLVREAQARRNPDFASNFSENVTNAMEVVSRAVLNSEDETEPAVVGGWTRRDLAGGLATLNGEALSDEYLEQADHLLAHLSYCAAPSERDDSYVLVPREPTRAMLNTAQDIVRAGSGMSWNGRTPQMMFAQAWRVMLAAAPSTPDAKAEEHPA